VSDTVIGLIALVGGVLLIWHLIIGFSTGDMESPGMAFLRGNRTKSPVRFWFLAAYNLIFSVAAVVVLGLALGL
jgi:hypothetical protein